MKCAFVALVAGNLTHKEAALKQAIESAQKVDKGTFEDILISPVDIAQSIGQQYQSGLSWAAQNGCEWVYFLDSRDRLHPKAFSHAGDTLHNHDAVFGLMVCDRGIVWPQLVEVTDATYLLLHTPTRVCEPTHMIQTSVAQSLPLDADSEMFDIVFTIWDTIRCTKLQQPLAIQSGPQTGTMYYTLESMQRVMQPKFVERGIFHGEPRVHAFYNNNFQKAWAFYHDHKINCFTDDRAPTYLKALPYYGPCPYETSNGRIVSLTSLADDCVAAKLLWAGEYEPMSLKLWETCALRHSGIVLDIGAYTGLYGLIAGMANFENSVIGFEPVPENYGRCVTNAQVNGLSNVAFQAMAMGDREGIIDITISAGAGFLATGAQVGDIRTKEARVRFPVRCVTLDNYLSALNLGEKLTLVKCDTEGFEANVILGGQKFIARDKPDIFMEITQDSDLQQRMAAWLKNLGYKFYVIDEVKMSVTETDILRPLDKMETLNRLITTSLPVV